LTAGIEVDDDDRGTSVGLRVGGSGGLEPPSIAGPPADRIGATTTAGASSLCAWSSIDASVVPPVSVAVRFGTGGGGLRRRLVSSGGADVSTSSSSDGSSWRRCIVRGGASLAGMSSDHGSRIGARWRFLAFTEVLAEGVASGVLGDGTGDEPVACGAKSAAGVSPVDASGEADSAGGAASGAAGAAGAA
jgi:hypothetical protein